MITVKTSELSGAALNWAVAKAEFACPIEDGLVTIFVKHNNYSPSSDWSQGGPIVEREGITLQADSHVKGQWFAWVIDLTASFRAGDTPLITAMRAFVASKLGDVVDVPEELL